MSAPKAALVSAFLRGYRALADSSSFAYALASAPNPSLNPPSSSRSLATDDSIDESLFWVALQAMTAICVMVAAFSLALMIRSNASALNSNVLNLTARQYQPV